MDRVETWLQERFGLTLDNYPAARAAAFREAMARHPESAWESLVPEVPALLSIPETHFARHPECFDALRSWLVERKTTVVGRPIRLWSAGCATGEEAYQLAALGLDVVGPSVEVYATDFSPDAVARAKTGVYHHWSMRGAASRALDWLKPTADGGVEVVASVRNKVQFRVGTLDGDGHPENVDAIFCRNVLIYFSLDGADRVLNRLAGALAQGGVLVTAPTDPSPPSLRGWPRVRTEGPPVRMYQRPDDARRAPSVPAAAPQEDFAEAVRRVLAGGGR
jgi:chemotaxis protein methyltransferase CheR